MTRREYERFDFLVTQCHVSLHDRTVQAMEVSRVEMRAIIAVYQELQRHSRKDDLAHDKKFLAAERKREKAKVRA